MRLGVVLLLGLAIAGCAQGGQDDDGQGEGATTVGGGGGGSTATGSTGTAPGTATAPTGTAGPRPCSAFNFPERRMSVLCTTKFQYDEYAGAFMAFGPGPEEDFPDGNRTHRFAPSRPLAWADLELEWLGGAELSVWPEGPAPAPQPSPANLGRLHEGTAQTGQLVRLCHPGSELRDPGLTLVDRSPLGGRVAIAFPFVVACA